MNILIFVIVFLAVLTQSVTGFGLALVSMGLLTQMLGIQVAAPLVAMVAAPLEFALLVRFRQALNWQAVWRLSLASACGIPIGMLALRHIDEKLILTVLGLILVGYALYALRSPRLPRLERSGWAFGFGFVAGLLSGAYNTGGPPAILYGNSRGWEPAEFKSNLQSFFLLNDTLVIAGHVLSRHLTPAVWENFLIAVPATVLGVVIGLGVERFVNPSAFRRIVLLLLIVMGLRLIF